MAKRRSPIPGLSFSLSRALGISAAKGRIARATGIPTTKSARQRKVGAGMGCLVLIAPILIGSAFLTARLLGV